MERRQVRYSGRVQGVGFRATAVAIARDYPVTGWVRNDPDGTVMLEAQGDPVQVAAYLDALGRRMGRMVADTRTEAVGILEGETGFAIRR